jgi:LytS/YehU family sensor histidine kinase
MMVWGLDAVNLFKFESTINWIEVLHPLHATHLIYMLTTIILTRFVFKKYYIIKKYRYILFSIIGLFALFIVLRYTLEELLMPYLFQISNYNTNTPFNYYVLDNLYYAAVNILLGFLIFLLDYQVGAQQTESKLLQQTREAELALLRSQISPHFLFNSLNNIYALSYKKSEKTPEAILKLSELIRYMLYEKQHLVMLSNEWEYVQHYIDLQQLRYDYPLPIDIVSIGDWSAIKIPPYLLIPFVENAFKHGDFTDPSVPLHLQLEVTQAQLVIFISNKIAQQQQKHEEGGIGLENVRRRLLLLYPQQHSLDIQEASGKFDIHLRINCK